MEPESTWIQNHSNNFFVPSFVLRGALSLTKCRYQDIFSYNDTSWTENSGLILRWLWYFIICQTSSLILISFRLKREVCPPRHCIFPVFPHHLFFCGCSVMINTTPQYHLHYTLTPEVKSRLYPFFCYHSWWIVENILLDCYNNISNDYDLGFSDWRIVVFDK